MVTRERCAGGLVDRPISSRPTRRRARAARAARAAARAVRPPAAAATQVLLPLPRPRPRPLATACRTAGSDLRHGAGLAGELELVKPDEDESSSLRTQWPGRERRGFWDTDARPALLLSTTFATRASSSSCIVLVQRRARDAACARTARETSVVCEARLRFAGLDRLQRGRHVGQRSTASPAHHAPAPPQQRAVRGAARPSERTQTACARSSGTPVLTQRSGCRPSPCLRCSLAVRSGLGAQQRPSSDHSIVRARGCAAQYAMRVR